MKKLLIVATLFIILISGNKNDTDFTLLDYFDGEYYAYTDSILSDESIDLGLCYMTNTHISIENVIGESMKIYNFEPISAINMLNGKILKTERVQDAIVFYVYSPIIKKSVNVFDSVVNLQIAFYDEYSIIGWPMILGSF